MSPWRISQSKKWVKAGRSDQGWSAWVCLNVASFFGFLHFSCFSVEFFECQTHNNSKHTTCHFSSIPLQNRHIFLSFERWCENTESSRLNLLLIMTQYFKTDINKQKRHQSNWKLTFCIFSLLSSFTILQHMNIFERWNDKKQKW